MIHYQLICSAGHGFDGWFRDSGTFERQARAGLVECPDCGDVAVNRALMAPSIPRKGRVIDSSGAEQVVAAGSEPTSPAPSESAKAVVAKEGAVMPAQVRAMLQKLRAEVESRCEHVGDRFAAEARAIHRGESEARPIYGESTPEQAEALAEEGIEVARIPWVKRADG